jgi:hypothetical protein
MKKKPRNIEVRNAIKKSDLYFWQVAEEMQIHENTLYRMLRHDLSDNQRARILDAINQIKSKH